MRIVHLVATDAFAGTERYVADVARELAARRHDVTVLGGQGEAMRAAIGTDVRWRAAPRPASAILRLASIGRVEVVHAHLTYAEVAGMLAQPVNRGRLVVTRHLATPRGRSRLGSLIAPAVGRAADVEIAISDFVAASVPEPVDLVIRNGVRESESLYDPESKTVVMVQRLEPEKDTVTGIQAWLASGLADLGWRLAIAGSGSEHERLRGELRRHPNGASVNLLGQVRDVPAVFRSAGIVLATAIAEPLGLSVLEAMAAGIPVVATASGGHLETIGAVPQSALFPPTDVLAASAALRSLALDEARRTTMSAAVRVWQQRCCSLSDHVDALEAVYG